MICERCNESGMYLNTTCGVCSGSGVESPLRDRVKQLESALTTIKTFCESPHWTNTRKHQILELATKALRTKVKS